ncbi:MAG: hypothetical protein WBM48_16350 [Polyangiales bacterium]
MRSCGALVAAAALREFAQDDEIPDDASLAELQTLREALFGENSY